VGTFTVVSNDPFEDTLKVALIGATPNAVDGDQDTIPVEYYLASAYPNPFYSKTTLSYGLPSSSHVSLSVYNLSGQAVSVLEEEYLSAGIHRATLNAKNMPSGLYFVRLNADNQTFTRKVMLIR